MIASIIGCAISLTGNILIAMKKRLGFYAWIAGNIAWILSAIKPLNIPLIVMNGAYIAINVYALWKWRKPNGK